MCNFKLISYYVFFDKFYISFYMLNINRIDSLVKYYGL